MSGDAAPFLCVGLGLVLVTWRAWPTSAKNQTPARSCHGVSTLPVTLSQTGRDLADSMHDCSPPTNGDDLLDDYRAGGLAANHSARLAEENLANGWLFEFHAAAAGAVAEESYLSVARNCDLYVIVLAAQASAATEAEYVTAFENNPRKILPFYLGALSPATAQLRNTIDSGVSHPSGVRIRERPDRRCCRRDRQRSHNRRNSPSAPRCEPGRAASTVGVSRARRVADQLHSARLPREQRDGRRLARVDDHAASDGALRLVLEGIGGSGKSYSASPPRAARSGQLPGHARCGTWLDVNHLVAAAFDAVGFFPGPDLQQQLARDGRLALIADGIDAIVSDDRRVLLHAESGGVFQRPPRGAACCVACADSSRMNSLRLNGLSSSRSATNRPRTCSRLSVLTATGSFPRRSVIWPDGRCGLGRFSTSAPMLRPGLYSCNG